MKTFRLHTTEDWEHVVDAILPMLKPRTILALSGPLGAGKTTFVQHLAKRLGVTRLVSSPTFALVRTYPLPRDRVTRGRLRRLVHVDAYRLERTSDIQALNLGEELVEQGTLVVIEWPENMRAWIKEKKAITLRIRVRRDGSRTVTWRDP